MLVAIELCVQSRLCKVWTRMLRTWRYLRRAARLGCAWLNLRKMSSTEDWFYIIIRLALTVHPLLYRVMHCADELTTYIHRTSAASNDNPIGKKPGKVVPSYPPPPRAKRGPNKYMGMQYFRPSPPYLPCASSPLRILRRLVCNNRHQLRELNHMFTDKPQPLRPKATRRTKWSHPADPLPSAKSGQTRPKCMGMCPHFHPSSPYVLCE